MKHKLILLFLFVSGIAFSQVTTSPSLPTANDAVTISFDATGTSLAGVTGDIYAHTGVTIGSSKWQNVIGNWGNNSSQPKLTRDGSNPNKYTLTITPTVFSFYGVPTSSNITEISFVFRSADATKQTNPDIFIPIYSAGLNIAISNPLNFSFFNLNETINITAESSINATITIFINNVSIGSISSNKILIQPYTFLNSGTYTIKATATTATETKETQISVYVKTPTVSQPIPTGLKKGVTKNLDNSVSFVLEAPNKTTVFLIGDFSNWQIQQNFQLKKDTNNTSLFWITIPNLNIDTEYAYQYLVDYTIKIADPYSEKILDPQNDQWIKPGNYPNLKAYPTGLTTGYVSTFKINETPYNWTITDFIRPAQDNLIIYELHIRDFVESDSYTEAITKLDYLKKLGVNAIELMPINEFEGADSWGYNPALYMAADKAYGTKNDLKKFVDECHKRGMAVLADVVFNHSYGQSPLLQMYWDSVANKPAINNPWYNRDHNLVDNTSAHWGYDFDHESTYTKTFFKDVLSYWINEYKIDGFRFDFTKGMSNTIYTGANNWASAYDASRIAILKGYADHVWSHKPTNKPYVIFEHLSENTEEKELANYGIMLWGNMNHNYNQNTMGYNTETDISWISYLQRGWNAPHIVGYMESHDEERVMFKNLQFGNNNGNYNVKNLNTALARQELAGMFFLTIPGPKMIWQFGELGYDISIDENGRVGRKPIKWDYFTNPNRKQIYNTWATLNAFKKQIPEVFNTSNFTLNVGSLTKSIILRDARADVVLLGNFDVVTKQITTQFSKTGVWFEYFTGEQLELTNTSQTITLNPGEYKMYSTVRFLDPRGGTSSDDSDNDGVNDSTDLCPNTFPGTSVNSTGCPLFSLPHNNYSIKVTSETCPNKNNGKLEITAVTTQNYVATISGINTSFTNSTTISNVAPGTYTLCITVTGQSYEQCYQVVIAAGTTISGKSSISANKMEIEIAQGTAPFDVFVNGEMMFKSLAPQFSVDVKHGDEVQVKTSIDCEGVFLEKVDLYQRIIAYPNPTNGN
ncbi:alpha-amylase family glycosyl hydrolase, partial [Lutibacter sp.]|uniref:alpha-amylase family glycosyl hydrolase n=1 Tax=Lutibacter sp. TaxID=1925666 RepID=UPI002732A161